MSSILMLAPAGNMTFGAMPSGTAYRSDANALIYVSNGSIADQRALQNAGCFTLSPFGGWGTFSFDSLASMYAADLATGLVLPGVVGFPVFTTCQVLNDPTVGNNGTWYKTSIGNGTGYWSFTSALSTSGAIQAAASAAAAATSAAIASASPPVSQAFLNAAATYVPKGVSAATISNAGTSGTNSTNNVATYTGGALTNNPIILYDVVGGLVVNLRIASPGVYVGVGSPVVPTVTLPNAGSGAALALTIGAIVSPGAYYWVVSSDGTELLLYSNASGSPAAVMVSGNQVNVPLGGSLVAINASISTLGTEIAALNADIGQLSISGTQYVGRPLASPPATGTATPPGSMFIFATPNANLGVLSTFEFYALGAGNIQLAKYTLSGGVFTRTWESSLIAISAAGLQTLTNTQFNGGAQLSVAANEYMAYFDQSGIACYIAGVADGAGWHTVASAPPTSFTDSGISTSAILQAQFSIAFTALQVTTATFQALQAEVTGLGTTVTGYSASITALQNDFATLSAASTQAIGRAGTPVAPQGGSASTFVLADVSTNDSTLETFEFWARATGTFNLVVFHLAGGVLTRTFKGPTITVSATGLQTFTGAQLNGGSPIEVPANSCVGFNDNGYIFGATSGTNGAGYCYGALDTTAIGYSPITAAYFQVAATLSFTGQVVTGTAFLAMQAAVAALQGGTGAVGLQDVATYTENLHLQENLIDPSQLVAGSVVSAAGGLSALGYPFQATGWFACNPGDKLVANFPTDVGLTGNYGWEFSSKPGGGTSVAFAGGVAGQDFTVPAACFYGRTSFRQDYDTKIGDAIIKRSVRSRGRLAGKVAFVIGDSIASIIGGVWQSYVTDRTGISFPTSDARGGRRMDQAFEMYQVSGSPLPQGNPTSGLSVGGQIGTTLPQYSDGTAGSAPYPQVNHGAGINAPNKCIFLGYIAGFTLHVVGVIQGAIAANMSFMNQALAVGVGNSGVTVPMGGTVVSGSGSTWTIGESVSQNIGSSSSPVVFYGINAWTSGKTLAQDLANVDLAILEMGGANDDVLHNVAVVAYMTGSVLNVSATSSYSGLPVPVIITPGMFIKTSFNGYTQLVSGVWQLVVTSMNAGSLPIQTNQWITNGSLGCIQLQLSGTPGGAGVYRLDISTAEGASGSPVAMTSSTSVVIIAQLTGTTGGAGTYSTNSAAVLGSSGAPIYMGLYGFGVVGCQAPMDGSYFGWILWTIQNLLIANPLIKILPFISEWTGNPNGAIAMNRPFCAVAMRAFYKNANLKYCDLFGECGVNGFTELATPTYLLSDRLHPAVPGGWNYGRCVTPCVEAVA